jgi:DNA polymerase-3 subunit alpha
MKFAEWIAEHQIPITVVPGGKRQFDIEEVGRFMVLRGVVKQDPITDELKELIIDAKNLVFELTDEERDTLATDDQIKYLVFEFGNCWYYSPVKPYKSDYNEYEYRVEFNDFLYLGKLEAEIDFVHLGLHTEYELLNSALNIKAAVKKAKFLGQDALGMCDRNTLGGALAFQLECVGAGIKPVIGMTISVATPVVIDKVTHPIIYEGKIYALNAAGWQNMLAISAAINKDKENPYVWEADLLKLGEGLAWVFSYEMGILRDQRDTTIYLNTIKRYKKAFTLVYQQYTSVTYTDPDFDLRLLRGSQFYFTTFSKILPPIYLDDIHYLSPADAQIKTTLNHIAGTINAESLEQYMRPGEVVLDCISEIFVRDGAYAKQAAEAVIIAMIENGTKLVAEVNFTIPTGQHRLPKFPTKDTKLKFGDHDYLKFTESNELFIHLVKCGFTDKVKLQLPKTEWKRYRLRMEEEIDVITNAGFADYFLILWDIIKSEKEAGGTVGPGRGSVGGSLVAYLLDITQVDPIKYDLLFERFLNKTRVSGERAKMADAMPDVDVDFESARRDEVKAYISRKYGRSYVCSVGSYTRMKLKGAIKSLCRVKGLDFKYANNLTADIDNQLEYSFKDLIAYAGAPGKDNLYEFVQRNPDVVETLKVILNNPSVTSVHPSAVIIVPRFDAEGNEVNIYNWLPIREVDGLLVTEWEGKYTDRGGFLKEDILGIGQLDKFKYILELIKRNTGEDLDLNAIPLDHPETYALFHEGYNTDVFQFGSFGLKTYSRLVKPDRIEDIIAMNALYRPGPMESNSHHKFAWIKNGKENKDTGRPHVPEYDYGLEEVTKATSGLYVYQEQIMRAVHVLGGLTLSEADEIRTVMKKFDQKKMATFQEKFTAGALERGCSVQEAGVIWEKLRAFSKYGFNKSHAAAYGLIAYWCQYLKANHPLEFWTAGFNFVPHTDRISGFIREMRRTHQNISVNPPDVNVSLGTFVANPDDDGIYWSLRQIKGIGDSICAAIIAVRSETGKFFSLEEFMTRCKGRKVTKGHVRTLILSGAFDKVEDLQYVTDRRKLLIQFYKLRGEDHELDALTADTQLTRKEYFWKQIQRDLIGYADINYRELLESSDAITDKMMQHYITPKRLFRHNLKNTRYGEPALVCGFLLHVKEKDSKNGKYAILELENNSEIIESIIWGDVWNQQDGDGIAFSKKVEGYKGHLVAFHGVMQYDTWRDNNRMGSDRQNTFILPL